MKKQNKIRQYIRMESLQSLIHAYDAEFRGRLGWFAQAVDAFPNNKTMQTYKQLFTECLVGLDEHHVMRYIF